MSSSSSQHTGVTAMGLLQAITSPTAVGSEPSPSFPKKPMYPSHHVGKERKRESMTMPKPAKKQQPQQQQQHHIVREALPVVGEEVELEGEQ